MSDERQAERGYQQNGGDGKQAGDLYRKQNIFSHALLYYTYFLIPGGAPECPEAPVQVGTPDAAVIQRCREAFSACTASLATRSASFSTNM